MSAPPRRRAAEEEAPPSGAGVLGPQLRRLRLARGMTLDALATSVGLDKGFLSRLERGRKAPSVGTLLRLSAALGVPVAELLGEALPEDAVRITRAARRRRSAPGHGMHGMESLTAGDAPLAAFIIHLGAEFAEDGPHEHEGEELLYVLHGHVELAFADRSLMLRAGDAAEFAGHLPHRLRRIGEEPAAVLVAVARHWS
ncbi:XRE family transcriptional regulator [Siccirubricoccus sp. KC 17139]|uniref:XRE family transcriptional regulator n=1 Tax=Siccirubricoccus soli TaxID=2899147 RepID=A0ABT1D3J3_9PROT|nr:XRE family transcriptional regulator [Siccirubricoccus soli]MCP2682621.1 XRE family transcriptional regulator [Siccirubricoccus soli]